MVVVIIFIFIIPTTTTTTTVTTTTTITTTPTVTITITIMVVVVVVLVVSVVAADSLIVSIILGIIVISATSSLHQPYAPRAPLSTQATDEQKTNLVLKPYRPLSRQPREDYWTS